MSSVVFFCAFCCNSNKCESFVRETCIPLLQMLRVMDGNGKKVAQKSFNPGANYLECKRQGSYDTCGDRVTKLGGNMFVLYAVVTIVPF